MTMPPVDLALALGVAAGGPAGRSVRGALQLIRHFPLIVALPLVAPGISLSAVT